MAEGNPIVSLPPPPHPVGLGGGDGSGSSNGGTREGHYQRPLCSYPGCTKQRKKGGYCKSHGGGIRCQVQGCSKSARDKISGLCAEHGGGRVCSVPGCNKRARHKTSGLCAAHGSGKRMREALSYGVRCSIEGCQKPAVDAKYAVCSEHRVSVPPETAVIDIGISTGVLPIAGINPDEKMAAADAEAYAQNTKRAKLQSGCENNDVNEVERLCQGDPTLAWHRRIADGCTPLHVAIMAGATEVADLLVKQPGVDVDSKNDQGETPLHLCATMGNVRMAVFLLDHHANVNAPDSSRATPLHKATVAGSLPMVQLLLDRGALPNLSNVHGDTPLHQAVRKPKCEEIVDAFLKASADVNAFNRSGQTALDLVPDDNTFLIQRLVSVGALRGAGKEPRAVLDDRNGKMPLLPSSDTHTSTQFRDSRARRKLGEEPRDMDKAAMTDFAGHPPLSLVNAPFHGHGKGDGMHMGSFLGAGGAGAAALSNGVERSEDEDEENIPPKAVCGMASEGRKVAGQAEEPLHNAILQGDKATFSSLMESSQDLATLLGKADRDGDTALHLAARKGELEMVKSIVSKGVSVNCRNPRTEETALHLAAGSGKEEVVKFLLQSGAEVHSLNSHKETALHHAACPYREEFLMIQQQGDGSELNEEEMKKKMDECGEAKLRIVRDLLSLGAQGNEQNVAGLTPLHLASQHESHELVKCLLQEGKAVVNVQGLGHVTPLHIATDMGRQVVVSCLLEHGADPNMRDSEGETPLHVAARKGTRALVEVLLRAHADPTLRNKHGLTPYEVAMRSNGTKSRPETSVQRLLKEAEERMVMAVGGRPANVAASSRSMSVDMGYGDLNEGLKSQASPKDDSTSTAGGSVRGLVAFGPMKKDTAKVINMEKAWWRLFFSKRPESQSLPLLQRNTSDVGAHTLRQMALLICHRLDVVSELVYFGMNERKEMGFHRTGFFTQLLHELVDKAGKPTMENLQDYLSRSAHVACQLLDATTHAPDTTLSQPTDEYFKEVFLCLPPEGYANSSQMPIHFKATKVRIGKLTQTSTWEQVKTALDNGLPTLTQQDTNFMLTPDQLLTKYELIFFVRYAWETEQKLPMPVLKVAVGKEGADWLCTTRRPYKVQDTICDSLNRAQPLFSMGGFLSLVEIYACYRPRGSNPDAVLPTEAMANPPSPLPSAGSEQEQQLGDQQAEGHGRRPRRALTSRGRSSPMRERAFTSADTPSKPPSAGKRKRARDVFSMSYGDLYSYLCYGDNSLGGDPNLLESGSTLAHHAAERGDVHRLALLVFFGADVHHKNNKGKTVMDLAAQYNHDEILNFLLWIETRELAVGGRVGDPPQVTSNQRRACSSAPPSQLPIGSMFVSPNGHTYETVTSPARQLDCIGGGLLYDVQRAGATSAVDSALPGFKSDLTLKLVEDLNEIGRLRDAGHVGSPFIMEAIDGFAHNLADETGAGGRRRWGALVMPRCGMSLDERIAGAGSVDYDHHQVYRWCYQIAEALKALQAAGVVHCDVRPRNIMIQHTGDQEMIKLANFGMAQRFESWGIVATTSNGLSRLDYIGTAPELIAGQPMDYATDCFSLGVVMVMLLTQRPEVSFQGQTQLFVSLSRGNNNLGHTLREMLNASEVQSEVVVEVATGLLQANGPDRMTASIASRILESLWQAQHTPTAGDMLASAAPPLTFHADAKILPLLHELYRCEAGWWRAKQGMSAQELSQSLKSMADAHRSLGNLLRAMELYQRLTSLAATHDLHDDMAEVTETLATLRSEYERVERHEGGGNKHHPRNHPPVAVQEEEEELDEDSLMALDEEDLLDTEDVDLDDMVGNKQKRRKLSEGGDGPPRRRKVGEEEDEAADHPVC